ncbi:hypothetical protein ACOSP7_003419 [Xanthoceras sorbifolium]
MTKLLLVIIFFITTAFFALPVPTVVPIDHLWLVQTWPPGFCSKAGGKHYNSARASKQQFVIHSLWPVDKNGVTVTSDDKNTPLPTINDILTWLNHHLTKIWPYVNEAASELIKTSVEPILEQYRPFVLSSLKFSKLTLGTVASKFTGL